MGRHSGKPVGNHLQRVADGYARTFFTVINSYYSTHNGLQNYDLYLNSFSYVSKKILPMVKILSDITSNSFFAIGKITHAGIGTKSIYQLYIIYIE